MSLITSFLSLMKPTPTDTTHTFNLDTYLNDNWDKLDTFAAKTITTDKLINNLSATEAGFGLDARQGKTIGDRLNSAEGTLEDHTTQLLDLENKISNEVILNPTITFGMNNVIKNTSKNSTTPKFTFTGKTLINPLGKDGNCEDTSKWVVDNSAIVALDSTNKVFGSNGIKITLASTTGGLKNLLSKYNVDVTQYYLISAYIKNGNATNVYMKKDTTGGGNAITSNLVTSTSEFTRVGIIVQPSDLNSGNYFGVFENGANTNYAYCDGIQINQITATEYALGTDALLAKYPYVDSYTCLTNPYAEIRHNNLVINGNTEKGVGYWSQLGTSQLAIVNNKFQITTTVADNGVCQIVSVKPNTNYYLAGNVSGNTSMYVNTSDNLTPIRSGVGTFNTGSNTKILIGIVNHVIGVGTFDSIMLVEGTAAPTEYKSCEIQRTVIEGRFADGDNVVYKDGKVSGSLNWKHKTLYGKDYDWKFHADFTGYKRISCTLTSNASSNSSIMVKYDGKIIPHVYPMTGGDQDYIGGDGVEYLSIADSDTGWLETVNPNNDEAKAVANGWKALTTVGVRYTSWVSIVDGSVPGGAITTTANGASNAGQRIVTVADGTKFVVGDYLTTQLGLVCDVITAISGNSITLANNLPNTIPNGTTIYKADNGTTNTSLLNYCMNNVAPGFEGWQLHYKTQNPEPITDLNVHIEGDILTLEEGENYVYLDSGMVLGEVANPKYDSSSSKWYINSLGVSGSNLLNKAELFSNLYKNEISDFSNWGYYPANPYAYGNAVASTTIFDSTATYTVDYKILATIAPQIGTISCEYVEDIISAINSLQEAVDSRQIGNSTLDDIIDLSLYEKLAQILIWRSFKTSSLVYVETFIPFSVKKTIPTLTLKNIQMVCNGVDYTSKFVMTSMFVYKNGFYISYSSADSAVIANFSYGFYCNKIVEVIADCRERV